MGLVLYPKYRVPGTSMRRPGSNKFRGVSTVELKIDLSLSTYVTGGWILAPEIVGMKHVQGMDILSHDCFGKSVDAHGEQLALVVGADEVARVKMFTSANTEAANGSTRAGQAFIRLHGRI